MLGHPLHQTATCVVPPGSGASGLNINAFRPPTQAKAGVVISAVKFQVMPNVPGAIAPPIIPGGGRNNYVYGAPYAALALGNAVTVAFSLVQYGASADAPSQTIGAFAGRVPLSILCGAQNVSAELLSGGFVAAGAGAAFTNINPISEYRYDLAEPLFIPQGWIFVPQLFGLGGNASGNAGLFAGANSGPIPELAVRVSYEGTILDPELYGEESDYADDTICLPFACSYLAPPVPVTSPATPYSASSDETNLVNIYDEPATITRFNGELIATPELDDLGSVQIGGAANNPASAMNLRLLAGNNAPLVRDMSPWRVVFDRQSRSWVCPPFDLDPGEFIIAALMGSGGTSAAGGFQPMIAATGYREVKRGTLAGAA